MNMNDLVAASTSSSTNNCDGCGKPQRFDEIKHIYVPLRKCSRCHQSSYHDVECQRRHYKVHKASCRHSCITTGTGGSSNIDGKDILIPTSAFNPKLFSVQKRDDGEQGLFAIQNIGPSSRDNIMSFHPLVPPILFDNFRKSHCALCFHSMKCIKNPIILCYNPRYTVLLCSEECEKKSEDWLPSETNLLKELLNMNEDMMVVSVAILVYRLVTSVPLNIVLTMQSHKKIQHQGNDEGEIIYQQAVMYTVANMILKTPVDLLKLNGLIYLGELRMAETLNEILRRIKFNSFTIVDDTNIAPGLALFEGPSFRINHSCDPSGRQTFVLHKGRSPQLNITIVKPIQRGDEISISYIENFYASIKHRREELWKSYNFYCRCSRCLAEE